MEPAKLEATDSETERAKNKPTESQSGSELDDKEAVTGEKEEPSRDSASDSSEGEQSITHKKTKEVFRKDIEERMKEMKENIEKMQRELNTTKTKHRNK